MWTDLQNPIASEYKGQVPHIDLTIRLDTNLSFEVLWMPDFSSELSKSKNKLGFAISIVLWDKKEVPQGSNTHQRLNGDIEKISLFDIV